jgi:hypothetical protein
VNMLVFLIVHTGLMNLVFLTKNDHEHYLPELELFHRQHKELNGVFLIQDGGASHIAASTQSYFAKSRGWWKPRYTPANASWLNQAEILIHAFKHYYLKRASWKSREEFETHVLASWPEYNHRYAHPIEWTWTNQKMRRWFAKNTLGRRKFKLPLPSRERVAVRGAGHDQAPCPKGLADWCDPYPLPQGERAK